MYFCKKFYEVPSWTERVLSLELRRQNIIDTILTQITSYMLYNTVKNRQIDALTKLVLLY